MASPHEQGELVDAFVDSYDLAALRAVRPPHALRKLATVLTVMFALLPLVLLLVPWQQNVSGTGRVTAFNPLDRTQVIPAPVTGRLVHLNVQEGDLVQKGDVMAEMADQDPDYVLRLEQQLKFVTDKLQAAESTVAFYDQQLKSLEEVRENAIDSATYELQQAVEKMRAEEQALAAARADYDQKKADRERKYRLFTNPLSIASELDFQRAEAASLSAEAKVAEAEAKVEQARNEREAKKAKVDQTRSEYQAKIQSTSSDRQTASGKVEEARKELADAMTKLQRQKTQTVEAPRDGYILRVHAANSADLLSQGDPLIELIPDTERLAVELWVSGNDAPLITAGRKARLQFEGWPAVQFAGWPSVAVGTFGGVVAVVDAQGTPDGRFRTLIVPDPEDEPWPEGRFLRQGARTNGWVLLETVSLGYEIWRQLNAFPPSIRSGPPGSEQMLDASDTEKKKKPKKDVKE